MDSSSRPSGRSPRAARLVLLLSAALTLALYAVPEVRVLSYPLVLLSTLAHELGHGLAALIVGGQFSSFELYTDGSGVATTGAVGRFAQAFVSAGGLVGPSFAAMLLFMMAKTPERARFGLSAIALSLLAVLFLVVRNVFGGIFIALVAVACGIIAWRGSALLSQLALVFGGTQLALSVYSRADYLFTPVAATSFGTLPSDVAQISEALLLPYWFWGIVCGAFSVAVLLFGVKHYWRS